MQNKTDFLFPVEGDVLFSVQDGTEENGVLKAMFTATAKPNSRVFLNHVAANEKDGVYSAEIVLDSYRNRVELYNETSGERQNITVFWFKDGYKKYRLTVDDVIWSLEDIYRKKYASIFENPFFAMLRQLHEQYDTQIQMHLYFQNDDNSFNLTMFPTLYKPEFAANANWLRFTFHAFQDQPDSPYRDASYDTVMREGRMVEHEIRRFAGKEVLCNSTAQHWGDSNIYATRAFRALGYKVLQAYFMFDQAGEPYVSYYLNKQQTHHAATRDFWVDTAEDIIFLKDDIIINEVPLAEIQPWLAEIAARPKDHAFMNLLTHEQYFYDFYSRYEPDYTQRMHAAVRFVHEHGYRPAFIGDIAFEQPLSRSVFSQ
ncbi:MAG: hypothetical protein RSB47_05235 [Ruthenibacterium sp.]